MNSKKAKPEEKKVEETAGVKPEEKLEVFETKEKVVEQVKQLLEKGIKDEENKERQESAKEIEELTREERLAMEEKAKLASWVPKTQLGHEVKSGKIKNIEEIFNFGRKILEPEIVDTLLQIKTDLLNIGQAKGKFGGGKRRSFKQTQKKTMEGNSMTFSVMAVAGNEDGYIGLGVGKAKETLPAREKSVRASKLGVVKIERGCGSYDCSCNEKHSIPMRVRGKCSSVEVVLIPAPQGTGLVAADELKKILKLAGIKDIYTQTFGFTRSTINLAKACIDALNKLNKMKTPEVKK